jgi:ABC-2 type transport system ATP-binding protein
MTAREFLLFFANLFDVENASHRIDKLVEQVDLQGFMNFRVGEFSRGMQQKLGLVRALLHDPQILFLDEPISALDPHGIHQVRKIILDQKEQGKAILISSHLLSEVERTADRVGILHSGKLIAEFPLHNMQRIYSHNAELEIELDNLPKNLINNLSKLKFVQSIVVNGNQLNLQIDSNKDYRKNISEMISSFGGLIIRMQYIENSLEKSFLEITDDFVHRIVQDEA